MLAYKLVVATRQVWPPGKDLALIQMLGIVLIFFSSSHFTGSLYRPGRLHESAFQRRQPNRLLPVDHVTRRDRYTAVWMCTWLIFSSNFLIFSSSVNVKMKARGQFTFPRLICSESDELVWAHLFKECQDRSHFPSLHYRHSFANWMVCLYHPQKPNERWWKCY